MTADPVSVLTALAEELATELDLHYEDPDLKRAATTIATLRSAVNWLAQGNHPVPDACGHILRRYALAK